MAYEVDGFDVGELATPIIATFNQISRYPIGLKHLGYIFSGLVLGAGALALIALTVASLVVGGLNFIITSALKIMTNLFTEADYSIIPDTNNASSAIGNGLSPLTIDIFLAFKNSIGSPLTPENKVGSFFYKALQTIMAAIILPIVIVMDIVKYSLLIPGILATLAIIATTFAIAALPAVPMWVADCVTGSEPEESYSERQSWTNSVGVDDKYEPIGNTDAPIHHGNPANLHGRPSRSTASSSLNHGAQDNLVYR